MNPNWLDWQIYSLFRWRWNKIFMNNPVLREMFISYCKSFDFLDVDTPIKVRVVIEEDYEKI